LPPSASTAVGTLIDEGVGVAFPWIRGSKESSPFPRARRLGSVVAMLIFNFL
jgi:hypothetical protein